MSFLLGKFKKILKEIFIQPFSTKNRKKKNEARKEKFYKLELRA